MIHKMLTPRKSGAISIVSLLANKEDILAFIADCWRIKRNNELMKLKRVPDFYQISYGFIVQASQEANSSQVNYEIIDECLLIRFSDEKIEIHFHGGTGVEARIIELLNSKGFKQGEKTQNHISNLFIHSRTEKEAKLIAAQPKRLKFSLLEVVRCLRAEQFEDAYKLIEQIMINSRILSQLENPPSVLLLGKPNVGKSTLFNFLAGFERVIVSDIAGTTRDVIENILSIKGWSIRFLDSAGIVKSNDFIEKASVIRTLKQAKRTDLIIIMLDATTEVIEEEKLILEKIKRENHIIVVNKSDIGQNLFTLEPCFNLLKISAKTGKNINLLIDMILINLGFAENIEDLVLPIEPLNIANLDYISCEIKKLIKQKNKSQNIELIKFLKKLQINLIQLD